MEYCPVLFETFRTNSRPDDLDITEYTNHRSYQHIYLTPTNDANHGNFSAIDANRINYLIKEFAAVCYVPEN
jgi:hypothetical protein